MYFACSYPLKPSSIVEPGNWGRILRQYTVQAGNPWLVIRELIYERIRTESFLSKPSRFDSTFLCLSEIDLKQFVQETSRRFDLCYEVRILDPNAPSHLGCTRIQNIENTDSISNIERKAREYWSGANIKLSEHITTSALEIVRRIDA